MLAGEMFYSMLVQVSVVQSGYIVTLSEQQALAQMYLVTILNPVPSSSVVPPPHGPQPDTPSHAKLLDQALQFFIGDTRLLCVFLLILL